GLHGVRLRCADEPDGASLDPPRRVHALDAVALEVDGAALVVRNDSLDLIERNLVEGRPEVPDSTVQRLHRNHLEFAGVDDATLTVGCGAFDLQAGHATVLGDHFDGLRPEVHVQATARRCDLARLTLLLFGPPLVHDAGHDEHLLAL